MTIFKTCEQVLQFCGLDTKLKSYERPGNKQMTFPLITLLFRFTDAGARGNGGIVDFICQYLIPIGDMSRIETLLKSLEFEDMFWVQSLEIMI